MGNVNERENTILRKNIELLEKGITVKKYLQLEKEFMIRGSTEIYNYFGFFVIYNELEKHFIMRVGLFGNHSTTTKPNQFCLEIILCRIRGAFDYLMYPYYPAYMG